MSYITKENIAFQQLFQGNTADWLSYFIDPFKTHSLPSVKMATEYLSLGIKFLFNSFVALNKTIFAFFKKDTHQSQQKDNYARDFAVIGGMKILYGLSIMMLNIVRAISLLISMLVVLPLVPVLVVCFCIESSKYETNKKNVLKQEKKILIDEYNLLKQKIKCDLRKTNHQLHEVSKLLSELLKENKQLTPRGTLNFFNVEYRPMSRETHELCDLNNLVEKLSNEYPVWTNSKSVQFDEFQLYLNDLEEHHLCFMQAATKLFEQINICLNTCSISINNN